MRFELRHQLPGARERVWEILFSDEYRRAVTEWSKIDRKCTSSWEEGGRKHRRMEVTSQREIPAPIAKVIGSSHLSYEMIEAHDDENFTIHWKVIPSRLADRVRAEGKYSLIDGSVPETCVRHIVGEVVVSIPIVGSQIEKIISKELESSYERGTQFARDWLSKQE
jgi:uncharacterized protein YndB with AHSA1/START domain